MRMDKFLADYVAKHHKGAPVPAPWMQELVRIAEGATSIESAEQRGVTRDAVKAQRKKLFKRLGVKNGHEIIMAMFQYVVKQLPSKE